MWKEIMSEERVEPKPDWSRWVQVWVPWWCRTCPLNRKRAEWSGHSWAFSCKGWTRMDAGFPPPNPTRLQKMPMQTWGPDLSEINFDDLILLPKAFDNQLEAGMKCLRRLRKPLRRLGSQKRREPTWAGAAAQYESEVVYHNMKEEFQS